MLPWQRNKLNPYRESEKQDYTQIPSGAGSSVSSVYSPAGKRGGFHSALQSPKVPCSSLGNALSTQLVFLMPTAKSARKKGRNEQIFLGPSVPLGPENHTACSPGSLCESDLEFKVAALSAQL